MAFILDTQGILLKHWIPSFLQGNYMESLCFSFLFQLLFLLVLCGLLMTLSSSVSFGVSSSLSHSLILTMPVIRLCSLLTASNGMPHSCCWKERSCFRPSSYALQPASGTFSHLYFAKVFSIVSVSLVGAYWCKSLLKLHFYPLKESLKEASINLSVGSKLMFANIASMLIIGIVRYGISIGWDITTFGKISLTLNVSNFLMVFISAVSVVLFPLLKHMEWGQLSNLYIRIRNCLSILILGAMIFYYPMKSLLSWWLPKYADSLIYMAVLFPVCLFECKVTLLVNTYLKSMRQEALILKINGIAVISSMMLTVVSVALFHNLTMAVFSIVFLYAGRCFLAEYHLQKLLSLNLRKDMMQEMLLVLVFIATGWKLNSWMTMIIYALCYGCYFILNRSKVHDVIMLIKK